MRLIESTSVPAYGDKIESPDGTNQYGSVGRRRRSWGDRTDACVIGGPDTGRFRDRIAPVRSLPEVLPGGTVSVVDAEVVGLPAVPPHPVRHRLVVDAYDTGMALLVEAAEALQLAAEACDAPEDAERFSALADRVRGYLAVSRSTTTLGMPRIPPGANRLTDDGVIHRSGSAGQSHIRVIPG